MKTIGDGMNIGEAAEKAGVTPKMVRHYESLGLLPKVHRTESGYRVYGESEVHTLRFIKRSRDLGFSVPVIGELVKLWQDRRRSSASVKKVASAHLAELDRKIMEMESMRKTLGHLIHCCHGDDRPDCPILGDLESFVAPATTKAKVKPQTLRASAKGTA
ncbi:MULTISPECIES: Cu(I)-responsive transcriptional regulator [unclassified Acidovorax]|jgi:Cu(I)-responsive transcriptional regulator|uniref:Cu(I)-responsive transcriptional regulator n=1 Tax=unclassified Acidovorax TaxID=2684926 RepID=UPI00023FD174|nr:Cu(I)-responsive transcriptional regulator [Acidovorax sp. NO-1]EHL22397.1 MerR family transcriptional regulator [Acidovorax sp. NO-1]